MKKVLIVDDDINLVDVIAGKLKDRIDIHVLKAYNYKEAISLIREHEDEIAVAIVDLHIPGTKDGGLLHLTNINEIPSIVLTSSTDKAVRKEMMQKHVLEYIAKSDLNSLTYAVDVTVRVLRNYDTGVMIVDDSAVSLNVMALSLEKLNVKIFKAHDGVEALEVLDRDGDKISLVLTDYQMPKMDGLELTQEIRKRYRKDRMAILVLSGEDDKDAVFDFFKVGANDFLSKPFNFEEFFIRMNINLDLIDLFRHSQEFANKNSLTGLFNRKFFMDSATMMLGKAKRHKRELCMIFFEIDAYGSMADRYGNEVGDIVVLAIVKHLNKTLRKSDLLAQYDAHEFAILIEDINEADSEKLAHRLQECFAHDRLEFGSKEITYSVSIGLYHGLSQEVSALVSATREAVTQAQDKGGNTLVKVKRS